MMTVIDFAKLRCRRCAEFRMDTPERLLSIWQGLPEARTYTSIQHASCGFLLSRKLIAVRGAKSPCCSVVT